MAALLSPDGAGSAEARFAAKAVGPAALGQKEVWRGNEVEGELVWSLTGLWGGGQG